MPRPFVNINLNLNVPVNNIREFREALLALERYEAAAGVPEEKAPRDGSEANNALIAYAMDKGIPAMKIPQREWAEPGIMDVKDRIEDAMMKGAVKVLDGQDPRETLNRVGLLAQRGMKAKVRSNIPPPLKKATLAARRRRGHMGTFTLRETGKFINSISYVVRKRT